MTEQTSVTVDALTAHCRKLCDAYEREIAVALDRLNRECARSEDLAEKLAAAHLENERLTEELQEVRRAAGQG